MEPNPSTQASPPLSIGGLLKTAREERNISLRMVSQKTKISVSLLEYLEADDLKKLPNKAYIIGFIKSYAKVLGINEQKCLDYFHHTYRRVFPESLPTPKPVRSRRRKKITINAPNIPVSFSNINLLWIGGSLIGLLSLLFLAVSLTGIDESENLNTEEIIDEMALEQSTDPSLEESPRPVTKEAIEPQVLSASTPLETEKDDPIKNTPQIKEEVEKTTETETAQTAIDQNDDTFLEKLKTTTFRKISSTPLYQVLHDDPYGDVAEYLPDSIINSAISGKQNLYIKATDGDTWLTYRKGKGATYQRHLKEGSFLYLQGEEIQVFMGNVNATKIFLNNLPLQITSKTGVKSLIFPQEKRSNYHLPLFLFKDDGTVIPSDEAIKQQEALLQ